MWETHQHVSKISKHFLSLCGDVQSHVSSLVLTVFSLHRRQSRALLLTNMNADLWSLCPLQPPSKGSQEGQPVLVPVQTLCWWKLPLPPSHQPPHSSEILSVCHTVTHIHTTQHNAHTEQPNKTWSRSEEEIEKIFQVWQRGVISSCQNCAFKRKKKKKTHNSTRVGVCLQQPLLIKTNDQIKWFASSDVQWLRS